MAKSRTAGVSLKPWLRHALPTLALLAAWRWAQAPDDPLSGPLVRVEQGVLLGAHRLTLYDAIPYFSFQGIPYAQPPVGELRFKAPVPPASWSDVRPALEEGHMCCQPHTEIYWMPPEVNKLIVPTVRRAWNIVSSLPRLWAQIRRFWAQQEDCLFLNVYTKQIRAAAADSEDDADDDIATAKLSPVVVFIHGGGFYTGTANSHIYGPDFLLREDVVLVTVQYRLGALGFLAPGSQDAPGNAGLKDQAMALKWVRRNIRRFGGDPASVTLVGHSAGGASVHYHAMSPMSRGLFHRAVQLSGCALNSWAYASPAEAGARARRLAGLLGCGAQCAAPDALVAFLRTKEPRELIEASYDVFENQIPAGQISPFVPTLDDETGGANDTTAFLRSSPEDVMAGRSPHYWPVPTLVGQNDAEGMIVLLPDVITKDMAPSGRNVALLEEDFERVVPSELGLARGSVDSRRVADMMRTHYLKEGEVVSGKSTETFVKIYGDLLFTIGLGKYMRALTRVSPQPTFFYLFSFDGRLSVVKKLVRGELPGVSHGDELGYLFPVDMMPAEDVRPGDVDLLVRDRWTRVVANFAKFGSPTGAAGDAVVDPVLNVSWPSSTPTRPQHVDIGASMQLRDGYPLEATLHFWDRVWTAVGRQGVSG